LGTDPNSKIWDSTVKHRLAALAPGQDFRYEFRDGYFGGYEYGKVVRQSDAHVDVDVRMPLGWRSTRRFGSLIVEIPFLPTEPTA
jgi:hypothetical protein